MGQVKFTPMKDGYTYTPYNHDEYAAAILRPFVREQCAWVAGNTAVSSWPIMANTSGPTRTNASLYKPQLAPARHALSLRFSLQPILAASCAIVDVRFDGNGTPNITAFDGLYHIISIVFRDAFINTCIYD